jgi:predicted phage-related endonuclease
MPIERIPLSDDRDAWLEARRKYVNASEMPVVCGEAGYGSLAELYAKKKGLVPDVDSGVLRRGRWGEAAVFQALADERPEWKVVRARVYIVDPDLRIGATPDGYCTAPDRDGPGLVQAKTVAPAVFRAKWLDDSDDSLEHGSATVPAPIRIQCATELMLEDRCQWAIVAALVTGEYQWTFRIFDIERDDLLEDRIRYHAHAFLQKHIDRDVMPDFQPLRDEGLVKLLFPFDDGSQIDLSSNNRVATAVEELTEVQASIRRMQDIEKSLKTELCAKLGEHTYARLADGRRLSWKLQHRKAYTVEAASFRVLRIQNRSVDT